jgi:hypothetical protein
LVLDRIGTLSLRFRFRPFLAKFGVPFLIVADTVTAFGDLPVDFLELVYVLRFIHGPKCTLIWAPRTGDPINCHYYEAG